jgi:hypothetical protein
LSFMIQGAHIRSVNKFQLRKGMLDVRGLMFDVKP